MNTQKPKQLRAAIIFEYPSLNGGEFSWLAALPALREANIEPIAIAPKNGPLADHLRREQVHVENWELRDGDAKLSQPQLRDQLAKILDRLRPDLVHANSLSTSRTMGPVTAQMRLPSIGHIRDIVRLSRQAVADLNQVDRLLAVSHATRDWHIEGGVHPRKIYVQYNGVDLDRFSQAKVEEQGSAPRRRSPRRPARLIGSIGQLGIRKGTEKILEAARLLADDFPDAHWVIAGERHSEKTEAVEFEANLREMASAAPLTGRVHFVGRIDHAHVAGWMSELCLLVHTARQEPLGRVLLEASAMSLPVVATNAGGTREVLGSAGQIVPIDDVAAIAKATADILSGRDDSTARSERLRRRCVAAFPANKRGKQLSEHYRSVLAEVTTRHHATEID